MPAKQIKAIVKLNCKAGEATPAPPIGPALGQHGIPIMEFVKEYNARTAKQKGMVIPAIITVYTDRSFTFVTKLPPVSDMIRKKINIQKGSGKTGKEMVGQITQKQIEEIAKEKMPDLNCNSIQSAINSVKGTARSMGVKIV